MELDINLYGPYARGSALADFLELLALQGEVPTKQMLGDAIRRNSWTTLPRQLFTSIGSQIEEITSDDDAEWADWTFTALRERAQNLGDRYPFHVGPDALSLRAGVDPFADYVRLLAITTAHSRRYKSGPDPRTLFELMTVACLKNAGFESYGMGTATTKGSDFPTSLASAGQALGFNASKTPEPRHVYAKDAGVDAIGTFSWGDQRSGHMFWLAQATCGSSVYWERKIREPRTHHWMSYLSEDLEPLAILAVPHHVEHDHFNFLLEPKATVMDRLRMVGRLDPIQPAEIDLIDWLLNSVWRLED